MNLIDTVSAAASRVRQVAKNLSDSVTASGVLTKIKLVARLLVAGVSLTATRVREIYRVMPAVVSTVATRSRDIYKTLAAVAGKVADLVTSKQVQRVLTAGVSAAASFIVYATAVMKPALDTLWNAAKRLSIWKAGNPK